MSGAGLSGGGGCGGGPDLRGGVPAARRHASPKDFTLGEHPDAAGVRVLPQSGEQLDRGRPGHLFADGVVYYLLDTQSLEMFADHTVYLAFYQGFLPSRELFSMAEDGSIAFAEGITGPHALFTLPLDESKADPAAVEDFLESSGINPMLGFGS